jgi:hypothetical protein
MSVTSFTSIRCDAAGVFTGLLQSSGKASMASLMGGNGIFIVHLSILRLSI